MQIDWFPPEQMIQEIKEEVSVSYDLTLEITYHYFHLILLVTVAELLQLHEENKTSNKHI